MAALISFRSRIYLPLLSVRAIYFLTYSSFQRWFNFLHPYFLITVFYLVSPYVFSSCSSLSLIFFTLVTLFYTLHVLFLILMFHSTLFFLTFLAVLLIFLFFYFLPCTFSIIPRCCFIVFLRLPVPHYFPDKSVRVKSLSPFESYFLISLLFSYSPSLTVPLTRAVSRHQQEQDCRLCWQTNKY
jgi:hypothetical protein